MIKLYEVEIEKLKQQISIMTATASTHIQDINDIHTDYRVKMEDLQKGNDILSKECKRRIDGLKNKDAPLQQFKQMENMIKQLIYDTKSKTLGFETMDSESEEEIIIVKKATGKVKTQK